MHRLQCGYQPYAWGKPGDTSRVASLVGESDASQRYAELWIGTHPSKPAKLHGTDTLLKELLTNDATAVDAEHKASFGADVPFLLKVLSIDKALSIQAHPTREHAVKLHAADPKNYPDPNHKPELVVALTPFQALCCFRPLAEMAAFVDAIAPLKALVPDFPAAARAAGTDAVQTKAAIHGALSAMYAADAATVSAAVAAHVAELSAIPEASRTLVQRVFLRTEAQFPGDIGCWMVYFLNVLEMTPGEALFMAPNEPHAYLIGDCVEIMAASDNVVRAGLTPKFKDVSTLLEMLTYRTDSLGDNKYEVSDAAVQAYVPPAWCTEFMLQAVRVAPGAPAATAALTSVSLAIVVSGTGTVNGTAVATGHSLCLGASVGQVTVEAAADSKEPLQVFFATTSVKR